MSSSAKRKAAASPDAEDRSRSTKKARSSTFADSTIETVESTFEKGQDFLRIIKASKDKTGRSIIDEFLTLPDADDVPGYYDQIKLPIAIDTIEAKLKKRQYPNLTALESDFKRLVQNAKDFNDKNSLIFADAERVRKGASNWFVKHNPAYKDQNYVARPTPLPGDNGTPVPSTRVTLKFTSKANGRTSAASATPAPTEKKEKEKEAEAEEAEEEAEEEADAEGEEDEVVAEQLSHFKGMSFQKAQEQLIAQLIEYKDPEDGELEIFTPFHYLPPRTLQNYYEVIKKPVSLKAIQKQIVGKVGRLPPTGVSAFKSWDELEEELSYIWNNCREYNEDGSEMFLLADEFEGVCKARLAMAREQVPGPPSTKIKLNLGGSKPAPATNTTIKLKLGGGSRPSASPAPDRKSATPGITVDAEALQRQRDMVNSSTTNGRPASAAGRNPLGASTRTTSGTPMPSLARAASAASPPAQTNGVKAEGQSPALSTIRPTVNGVGTMPPPTSRPVSGSPHPQTLPNGVNGITQPPPQWQPPATNTFMQSKLRPAGQSAKDSILPSLTLIQHPSVPTSATKPIFSRTIKAHPRLLEQSVTYTVPASKTYFQVIPYIPPSVTSRAYRIFVMVNGQRVSPRTMVGEEVVDRGRMSYECRLERGAVGRVEVEVLAEKRNKKVASAGEAGEGKKKEDEVDREKVTIFVHVMRN